MKQTWKQIMIQTIRQGWYYKDGELEALPENEVREIYEAYIDWMS